MPLDYESGARAAAAAGASVAVNAASSPSLTGARVALVEYH